MEHEQRGYRKEFCDASGEGQAWHACAGAAVARRAERVVLWLLLSVLTLLHSGALIATLYDVALAKARSCTACCRENENELPGLAASERCSWLWACAQRTDRLACPCA